MFAIKRECNKAKEESWDRHSSTCNMADIFTRSYNETAEVQATN
jgi:hypothetical protein